VEQTAERDSRRPVADAFDDDAPWVPWADFSAEFQTVWAENQKGKAQHVTLVGPNGQGKSMLALGIIAERARLRDSHVVVIATKPRDRTLAALGRRPDWSIIRKWPPSYGQRCVIFWPPFGDVRDVTERHREIMADTLAAIFHDGNRVVYFDEAYYIADDLGAEPIMRKMWQMGRSQNLVVVAGTQRPVAVPRAMFSECSWFFAFRTTDEDELRRVSEIGGADTRSLRAIMRTLKPHEFVACQTRTGRMVRSKMDVGRGR
jgi:hypothetical protein